MLTLLGLACMTVILCTYVNHPIVATNATSCHPHRLSERINLVGLKSSYVVKSVGIHQAIMEWLTLQFSHWKGFGQQTSKQNEHIASRAEEVACETSRGTLLVCGPMPQNSYHCSEADNR